MVGIRKGITRFCALTGVVGLIAIALPTSWAQAAPSGSPASPTHPVSTAPQLPSPASSAPAHQIYTSPQPPSNADFSGNGANTHGPYDSTRSGAPALNGNGGGVAVGKPCAACVGKADNKNPAGQLPGGSDPNAGYECDRNHGIARTNPAHTGCLLAAGSSSSSTSPSTPLSTAPGSSGTSSGGTSSGCTGGSPAPSLGTLGASTARLGAPSSALASTGTALGALLTAALVLLAAGFAFAAAGRSRRQARHVA
jgi:hypothetical protein